MSSLFIRAAPTPAGPLAKPWASSGILLAVAAGGDSADYRCAGRGKASPPNERTRSWNRRVDPPDERTGRRSDAAARMIRPLQQGTALHGVRPAGPGFGLVPQNPPLGTTSPDGEGVRRGPWAIQAGGGRSSARLLAPAATAPGGDLVESGVALRRGAHHPAAFFFAHEIRGGEPPPSCHRATLAVKTRPQSPVEAFSRSQWTRTTPRSRLGSGFEGLIRTPRRGPCHGAGG